MITLTAKVGRDNSNKYSFTASLVAIVIAMLLVPLAHVTAASPPVIEGTLDGAWEATLDGPVGLIRMDIRMEYRPYGHFSHLAYTLLPTENGSFLYHLMKEDVRAAVLVSARFRPSHLNPDEPDIIVRFKGWVVEGHSFETTVAGIGRTRPVVFYRAGYYQRMVKMSKVAEKRSYYQWMVKCSKVAEKRIKEAKAADRVLLR
jgi:hypothetical protein